MESSVAHTASHDPEYGNPYALFQPSSDQLAAGFAVKVRFVAIRLEHVCEALSRTRQARSPERSHR